MNIDDITIKQARELVDEAPVDRWQRWRGVCSMRFGETLSTGGAAYVGWQVGSALLSQPVDAGMLTTGLAMSIVGFIVTAMLPRAGWPGK